MCPTAPSGLWVIGIKKDLARVFPRHALCVAEALADMQAATVHSHSVASAQLTTPGHGYNGDTTRQDGTTGQARFSKVER
jgi:hypothetical protein